MDGCHSLNHSFLKKLLSSYILFLSQDPSSIIFSNFHWNTKYLLIKKNMEIKCTFTIPLFLSFSDSGNWTKIPYLKARKPPTPFLLSCEKWRAINMRIASLNMILPTILHEKDQSQVADIVGIMWELEEVVLIYTSCRIDSKTITLFFWFLWFYSFVLWGFNLSSCLSAQKDGIQCWTAHSFMVLYACYCTEARGP